MKHKVSCAPFRSELPSVEFSKFSGFDFEECANEWLRLLENEMPSKAYEILVSKLKGEFKTGFPVLRVIDKIRFWGIEQYVIRPNYHIRAIGDLWMSADCDGKFYKTKDNQTVLS